MTDPQLGLWPSEDDFQAQLWAAARDALGAYDLPLPNPGEGPDSYRGRLMAALATATGGDIPWPMMEVSDE